MKYNGVTNYEYANLKKPFSITMYVYLCEHISSRFELTEHIEKNWCTVNEMRTMNFALADKPIIGMIENQCFLEAKASISIHEKT